MTFAVDLQCVSCDELSACGTFNATLSFCSNVSMLLDTRLCAAFPLPSPLCF